MFVLLFVLTGCSNQNSQNNQDTLKSKVKEEISYLDNNLISTLNIVNNLSYDNYKVSSKNIQSNKSDNNEKQNNSTEQESTFRRLKSTRRKGRE